MFDFRYHALSLTAVIVALVLGVLLGVAIGDRGLVSSGEKAIRNDLRGDVAAANHHAGELQGKLNDRKDVLDGVSSLLIDGQLAGRNVGVVFLGPKSTTDNGYISKALKASGGNAAWVMALKEPLDTKAIADNAQGTQYAALGDDPTLYGKLGLRVGTQLVQGGQLISNERSSLSDSFDGKLAPVQTIVLIRDTPTDLDPSQKSNVEAFEQGVVTGLQQPGAVVVGAETDATTPSQTSWYDQQGLTYISDLDEVEGQISLIYALNGSQGRFGHGVHEQVLPSIAGNG
jgi:Copper transport outer membrane protein, MctB